MPSNPVFELHDGDGTAGPFQFDFELPGTYSGVRVRVKLASTGLFVTQVEDEDYSLVRSTRTVTFLAGSFPPVGTANIRIERNTTRDRQIDYVSGETLSEPNLDNDANRLTMVDQEIEAGITDALRRNDNRTAWDAEAIPSENAAPAISTTGWVTLGQVQALLADVQVADLNEPTVLTFTANGTDSDFLLSGAVGLKTSQPTIWMNGVIQRSDSGDFEIIVAADSLYPSWADGNDVLSFDVAPPSGAIIHVRIFTGTVLGVLPDSFINDSDQIADNIVNEAHIKVSTGSAGRIMVFDATGEPTLPVASLSHLINSSQSLPAAALTALVASGTGIAMDLLNRNPVNPVHMGSQRITNLAEPVDPSDAATRAFALGAGQQMSRGSVAEADFPLAPHAIHEIQDIGFPPDVFFLVILKTGSDAQSLGIWVRGGVNQKRVLMIGERFTGQSGFKPSYRGIFLMEAVGPNIKISNEYRNSDNPGASPFLTLNLTHMFWFAIKV